MAQVKLLKIVSGLPEEMDTSADDITLNSYTVQGGGPVLSGTGLDLQTQGISNSGDIDFDDPNVNTIEQTAGALIIDNIMAKERENVMTTAGAVLFPVISDDVDQVDSFRLPALAGVPTAAPADGGEGYLVWDSTNNHLYAWDGAAWDNLSTVDSAASVDVSFTSGGVAIRDAVYIDSNGKVLPAQADALSTSQVVGFATAAAADTNPVLVRVDGVLGGFTGLTPGDRYFLDDGTAGQIINSGLPSDAGDVVFFVGVAKSATELYIDKQFIARRS